MGRSVAQFFLSGASPEQVLGTAQAFAPLEKLQVVEASPNHVALSRGHEWVAGKKVLVVAAWPAQGGVNVQVVAFWHGEPWGEMNANPRELVGRWPRRDLWKTLCALLARLGISHAEAVVRHY